MGGHDLWMWGGFLAIILVLLAFDLGILHKKSKEIGFKDALKTISFYVFLALCFGAGIYHFMGAQKGTEFFTGYLIELTLSIDNVFVFVLIFTHFAVPKQYHYKVLIWGVLVAIILRFIFIAAGTTLIHHFDWVLYVFGGFLLLTGIKMIKASDAEPDMDRNIVYKLCKKNFRVTEDYVEDKFFLRQNGLLYVTPLFVVLMVINFVDVVFAFDSIPAIFAITTDTFIVYTSNIFAVMGLRSMYFVLANVVERFKYLKYGLSAVLILIGTKMIINHAAHGGHIPESLSISTLTSLVATALIIVSSILYSLYKTKGVVTKEPFKGWVPGSPEEDYKEYKNKDK
jgi:tellurite resistance protein TerC